MLNCFCNSDNNKSQSSPSGKENRSLLFKITTINGPGHLVLGYVDNNNAANLETYATSDGKVVSVKSSVNNTLHEEDAMKIDLKKYQGGLLIHFEHQMKNALI